MHWVGQDELKWVFPEEIGRSRTEREEVSPPGQEFSVDAATRGCELSLS